MDILFDVNNLTPKEAYVIGLAAGQRNITKSIMEAMARPMTNPMVFGAQIYDLDMDTHKKFWGVIYEKSGLDPDGNYSFDNENGWVFAGDPPDDDEGDEELDSSHALGQMFGAGL
jgi:hypothetical protein